MPYKYGTFFITLTNASWLPLFKEANVYDVVYNWFDYLKNEGHFVNAFVIMPDHLHAIVSFSYTEKSLTVSISSQKTPHLSVIFVSIISISFEAIKFFLVRRQYKLVHSR